MDRVVAEHQQFSHSIKDLEDWVADAVHMLDSYCHPTADKSVLDSRMLKLEVWKQQTPKPALFRYVKKNANRQYFTLIVEKALSLHCFLDLNDTPFRRSAFPVNSTFSDTL